MVLPTACCCAAPVESLDQGIGLCRWRGCPGKAWRNHMQTVAAAFVGGCWWLAEHGRLAVRLQELITLS